MRRDLGSDLSSGLIYIYLRSDLRSVSLSTEEGSDIYTRVFVSVYVCMHGYVSMCVCACVHTQGAVALAEEGAGARVGEMD